MLNKCCMPNKIGAEYYFYIARFAAHWRRAKLEFGSLPEKFAHPWSTLKLKAVVFMSNYVNLWS